MQISHPIKDKRVLVIGLGLSGQAAVKFLLRREALVTGADRNHDLLKKNYNILELIKSGMIPLHDSTSCDVRNFDLVVISPGVPQSHPYYKQARELGIETIGEVELACRDIQRPCVGITGTNGKTTVTMLVEHVLNRSGRKALALGNVGIPLTSAVDEASNADVEIFVIELSSFQLETMSTRFLDAGVLLNVTPDHLDRYSSMQDYAKAKLKLRECLKPNGKLFVEEKCAQSFQSLFKGYHCFIYGYSKANYIHTDTINVYSNNGDHFELPLEYQGRMSHDIENIMAAYALCEFLRIKPQSFLKALEGFNKPPHRIEFVRTISEVHYFDDSKGTNIDAVERAVERLGDSIILIAGGVDKGFPYTQWVHSFNGKVKSICAIGQSAPKIKNDLEKNIEVEIFPSLEEAVKHASSIALPGDKILLSPGCSSYDMFKDYAHRGQEFQRIVNAL